MTVSIAAGRGVRVTDLAEPDELTLAEMDAFDLRHIHFPAEVPDRVGYQCTLVNDRVLELVGYTGKVTRGVALGSGRVYWLRRDSDGPWKGQGFKPEHGSLLAMDWDQVDSPADVDTLKAWLRGNS